MRLLDFVTFNLSRYAHLVKARLLIAIIRTPTLEGKAVEELFNEPYNRLGEYYRKKGGNDNAYVTGRIRT